MRCSDCGDQCRVDDGELVDLVDGLPHRLACSRGDRRGRWLHKGRARCERCGGERQHQTVRDRRGEVVRCLACGLGRYVPMLRDGTGMALPPAGRKRA